MRTGRSAPFLLCCEVSSDSFICKRRRLQEAPSTQRGVYCEDSGPSHRLQGRPESQGPERVKWGRPGHPSNGRLWCCQRDSALDRHKFLNQTKANKHQMHEVEGVGINHERWCCVPSLKAAELSKQNCNRLALQRPKPGLWMGTQAAGGFPEAPCVGDGCPAPRGY